MKIASCDDNTPLTAQGELEDGLIGCGQWRSRFEGPYTQLAKIGMLNALDAGGLCKELFRMGLVTGRAEPLHGRSLLGGPWLPLDGLRHPVAKSIASHALSHLCGPWASWIASDHRFRYCQSCLDRGFQSAIYQIDGLEVCPVHGDPLLATCPSCGAAAPPYALTRESLDFPCHCPKCGTAYSDAWTSAGFMDKWQTPAHEYRLASLYAWLRRLNRVDIDWPELRAWRLSPSDSHFSATLRKAVFGVLTTILPLPGYLRVAGSPKLRAELRDCLTENPAVFLSDEPFTRERIQIYRSIRRHIERQIKPYRVLDMLGGRDFLSIDWKTGAVIASAKLRNPEIHGWFLWRHRCEEAFHAAFLDYAHAPQRCEVNERSVRLRRAVLRWPIDWGVNAATWGHFVLHCFHQDVEAARGWQTDTLDLGDPFSESSGSAENKDARQLYLEAYAKWTARLSPQIEAWPSSVTALSWRTHGTAKRQVGLFSLISTT